MKNALLQNERVQEKLIDTVVLSEEDNEDITKIFESSREEDILDGMKVLWEEQLKQLSSTSKKRHR